MADNVTVDNGALTDFSVSSDEGAGGHVQRVKLAYSADGSETHVDANALGLKVQLGTELPAGTQAIGKLAANSGVDIGDVDVTSVSGDVTVVQSTASNLKVDASGTTVPVSNAGTFATQATLQTGDNTIGRMKLTDGTTVATVRDVTGGNDALNVAITKSDGTIVESFGGSGGTSMVDDAAFTEASDSVTPIGAVFDSDINDADENDVGVVRMTAERALHINVAASDLDVAHDEADAGMPVKIGSRGVSALPTAVTTDDRANAISDLFGRILTAHIDPAMQVWKNKTYTSAQTGGVLWDPTSTKRIAITYIAVGSYGTTAGRMILWFGANGDTSFTQDTDQVVFAASFAPSSSAKPGAIVTPPVPIVCNTADYELHITTDAALSVDVTVYGYEF